MKSLKLLMINLGAIISRAIRSSKIDQQPGTQAGFGDVAQSLFRDLGRELRDDLSWRLQLANILIAGAMLGAAVVLKLHDPVFGSLWLAVASSQLFLQFILLKQSEPERILGFARMIVYSQALWLVLAETCPMPGLFKAGLAFVSVILFVGNVPCGAAMGSIYSAFAILFATANLWPSTGLIIASVIALTIAALSVKSGAVLRLSILSRVALTAISKRSGNQREMIDEKRLLAALLGMIASAPRQILLHESGAEVIEEDSIAETIAEGPFFSSLRQIIEDRSRDDGLIAADTLSEEYIPSFVDWFNFVPKYIFFFKLVFRSDGKATTIYILLPIPLAARIAGLKRTLRVLVAMSSLVRQAIYASAHTIQSTDAIVRSQRNLTESEGELNQIIHHVNNVVQDIAIHCDKIKSSKVSEADPSILEQIGQIERAGKFLAASVSDLKRGRELMLSKVRAKSEPVDLLAVIDEICEFGQHLAHRRGREFEALRAPLGGVFVMAPGRDLLETSLRLALRFASNQLVSGAKLIFHVTIETNQAVIIIPMTSDLPLKDTSGGIFGEAEGASAAGGAESAFIKAVQNLCLASKGSFQLRASAKATSGSELVMALPFATKLNKSDDKAGDWLLLVDDKPDVVTFYRKIADALNVIAETAESTEQAINIVKQKGQPKLTITDLQLGQESGLSLIKYLRDEFGSLPAIIAVSGHSDSGIEQEAISAGANTYIVKPVGRAKLVSVIKGGLGI